MFKLLKAKKLKVKGLILDFHVRWNSTVKMIDRLIKLKDIVNQIATDAESIDGLTTAKATQVMNLALNNNHWKLLTILKKNLLPFEIATRLLSGRNYATLGISKVVENNLKTFFETQLTIHDLPEENEVFIKKENLMRSLLLEYIEKYFNVKQTEVQKQRSLMACYLNPSMCKYLSNDEQDEAEQKFN